MSPPLDHILSMLNPVYTTTSLLFQVHFMMRLPSTSRSFKGAFLFSILPKLYMHFSFPQYVPHVLFI